MQLSTWHKMYTTSNWLFLFSFPLMNRNFNILTCINPRYFKLFNSRFFQRCLVEMMCSFFVASWTGVVKYHGPRPSIRPKQVCLMYIDASMFLFTYPSKCECYLLIICIFLYWTGFCGQSYFHDWFHYLRTDDCICCYYAEALTPTQTPDTTQIRIHGYLSNRSNST